jgi:intracellular septation protein A
MTLWTYRRPFVVDGVAYRVDVAAGLASVRSRLLCDGRVLAEEQTAISAGEPRNTMLRAALPDGRALEVEVGPVSSFSFGIAVRVAGELRHESHPGRRLAWPAWARGGASSGVDAGATGAGASRAGEPESESEAGLREAREAREERERWQRNKPSVYADIALGVLFFAVTKLSGSLTIAALVGAAAGLALVVVQRFVKVDLLGGLALFGIAVLLLSAGFALVFQDDWAVKMRSTIVGSLVALVMLSDGLFNGGRYFGGRIQRYMPTPLDPRRFAIGMGVLGLVMAAVNYAVATWTTGDTWLWYTTVGDTILSVVLVFAVLQFAQRRSLEAP